MRFYPAQRGALHEARLRWSGSGFLGWGRRCGPRAADQARPTPRWPRARARGLVRRLRVCFARTPPGGLGSLSVPNTWGCPQGLDEDRMNAGESLRDQGRCMPPVRPRKHGPEAQNRRQWSAERRARLRTTRTAPHTRGLSVRLPALHSPSLFDEVEKETTASPAPQTIRAAELCLNSPLTARGRGRSERRGVGPLQNAPEAHM